jgi:hypothetical protein
VGADDRDAVTPRWRASGTALMQELELRPYGG